MFVRCPRCGTELSATIMEEYEGVALEISGVGAGACFDYRTEDAGNHIGSYIEEIYCLDCDFRAEDEEEITDLLYWLTSEEEQRDG